MPADLSRESLAADHPAPVPTIISLFRRAAQLMVDELTERIGQAGFEGLTAAAHPVFENIDPAGTRLTELAARARMTHQSMGELVATLVDKGYLERRPDLSDGRARLICLTERGRRMTRRAIREISAIEAVWTKHFEHKLGSNSLKALLATTIEQVAPTRGRDRPPT
jgi:DNA-binding MarR family transcriptional regulator